MFLLKNITFKTWYFITMIYSYLYRWHSGFIFMILSFLFIKFQSLSFAFVWLPCSYSVSLFYSCMFSQKFLNVFHLGYFLLFSYLISSNIWVPRNILWNIFFQCLFLRHTLVDLRCGSISAVLLQLVHVYHLALLAGIYHHGSSSWCSWLGHLLQCQNCIVYYDASEKSGCCISFPATWNWA